MVETITVTIETDGESDTVAIPAGLLERLAEPGTPPAEVVADVVLTSFTGRAHALRHHGAGEPDEALEAAETDLMDRFEDRFGVTYAEATGHSH